MAMPNADLPAAKQTVLGFYVTAREASEQWRSAPDVREIQPVPFTMKDVAFVTVTKLFPIAPLLLTTFSVD